MNRANKILALVLATQLAFIAYIYRPHHSDGPPAVSFFTGIKAEQVTGLTIADANQSLAIKKTDNGWQLQTTPAYPADTGKIRTLLQKLLTLTSSRLVARTETSHGRLKVAANDFNRKLTLSLSNGETRELLLGTSPNYKTIHVRSPKDDNVYLVNDLADWETPVNREDWWSNNYLDVEPAKLSHLILTNHLGRIDLARDEKNNWRAAEAPPEQELADEALHNFLNKACLIQLSTYLGTKKPQNFNKPLADLELITAESSVRLQVAAKDAAKDEYLAKASNSEFYVTVHGYEIKALLETDLHNLLTEKKTTASTSK